ncbi:hypothetical protein vBPFY1MI_99 [Pseudomonas phage vB_PF_Y1-MI]|nr:hypothetical protein vBPFY1MI_99 [Pseudomonas phage vB_PF_Y1-MI]
MVMYCEVFKTAKDSFDSAGLHLIMPSLGKCKLGRVNGVWYVIWGGYNG